MFRRGIMATQLLATLTIVYHLLRYEIVVYPVNLRHPFLPPLLMCISCLNPRDGPMSHSVSCSIFEKIDPSRVFFPHVMLTGILRARLQDNDGDRINVPMKCNLDREDCASLRFPFTLPYA